MPKHEVAIGCPAARLLFVRLVLGTCDEIARGSVYIAQFHSRNTAIGDQPIPYVRGQFMPVLFLKAVKCR